MQCNSSVVCVFKGAPERILERCTRVRLNGAREEELTESLREQILDHVTAYGTGADTLRCLALATVDSPIPTDKMNLQDPSTFCDYEASIVINHCLCY